MKRFQYFIQQRIRQACIIMVATTALWACSQKHEITETRDTGRSQIVAQARAYYESNHKTLTKTVGEYDIHIKPLPGEIIPLWNQAVTALTNDGGSWVDVPLETALTYTAIRHAHHTHQEGVQCSHDTPVLATQKLSIYTAPDGTQQSYIVTLVPETETTAIDLNDFSSANGLIGFSGFASWHNLDGTLIRVAKYDNGHTTQSAEATEENNALVLEIVDNTYLVPNQISPLNTSLSITKAGSDDRCNFCHQPDCQAFNDGFNHCNVCGQYDPKNDPSKSKCVCARCQSCGKHYTGRWKIDPTCTCGATIEKVGCEICKTLICNHLLYGDDDPPGAPVFAPTAHEEMLKNIFAEELTYGEFKYFRDGSHTIDAYEYQTSGNEYLHGMRYYTDNQNNALTNMKNHFIQKMRGFVQYGDMLALGEGFHPILDTYLDMETRKNMLASYSYAALYNIVHGMNAAPYAINPTPCTEAVTYIYNALSNLPSSASDEQIGAIFDQWVSMAQGNPLPGLPLL